MRKISFIASLMMLLVFHSCKMDNEILDVNEKTREIIGESYFNDRSSNEGMIVLGAKLNDPYRYETMLRAQNEYMDYIVCHYLLRQIKRVIPQIHQYIIYC